MGIQNSGRFIKAKVANGTEESEASNFAGVLRKEGNRDDEFVAAYPAAPLFLLFVAALTTETI